MRSLIRYSLFFAILLLASDTFAGCGDDANPAIKVMCDIVILLQGRLGRVMITVSLMMTGWQFANGGVKWEGIATLFVGIGLLYAPKTFALLLLPDYLEGIQGNGYSPDVKVTPDEIISCACPDLK